MNLCSSGVDRHTMEQRIKRRLIIALSTLHHGFEKGAHIQAILCHLLSMQGQRKEKEHCADIP